MITASQTWLKWDFVIWIGCCLATLNHAADQKCSDGSLSPWLWQIPGASWLCVSSAPCRVWSPRLLRLRRSRTLDPCSHMIWLRIYGERGDAATGRNNKRLSLELSCRQSPQRKTIGKKEKEEGGNDYVSFERRKE